MLQRLGTLPDDFAPTSDLLAGRAVLVAGAAGEVGREVALACARCGAAVYLLDHHGRELEVIYDDIAAIGAPEPAIVELDLRKFTPEMGDSLLSQILGEEAALDGLVHAPVWSAPLTPLEIYNLKAWEETLHNCLTAPYLLTRSLFPALERSNGASVVFSSMDVGRRGRAYWGALAAALAGLENVSRVWADETENRPLRFNTLDPGRIRSALRRKFYPAESGEGLRPPDDPLLLDTYLYLLSDASRKESGMQFTVPDA